MIRSGLKLLVAGRLVTMGASAFAAGYNCDCAQIVGSCAASISVKPTDSTKGSYGAELTITSSSPICSKVDYYIDSTPYFTVLSQGNTASDSTYGLKPIFRENVKIESCKVCKQVGAEPAKDAQKTAPESASGDADLSGRWAVTEICSWGRGSGELSLTKAGAGSYSVTGSFSNITVDSGRVDGSNVSIQGTYHGFFGSNNATYTGTVTDPTSIQGAYTQTKSAEVCNWNGRKI
ncbi:hypothetical protein FEA48_21125 [Pseudomonas nitroreducens]|uniref:Uncharacterized protein n=1 Tax=Pseudomonas nitroreducens TaxID=46680 RepID=A0A5R8ZY14_PSENT|nr:hypothetical protein [Pseudomonas nitroreducens]TLP71329.1 hypothetical protein FEA48_21125 [Pseudomonas nitroreducens]